MTKARFTASTSALAFGMSVFSLTQPALAQDAGQSAQPAAAEQAAAEIIVTGSRISRRDYTSSSPIVTTDIQQIKDSGQVNLEEVLGQLPQAVPGRNAGTANSLGGGGRATVNLRGLGEQRNLVLLDGRRLPLSGSDGLVDINLIPSAIISSVEVVTGGASAVYGSDAISGVVNFKTVTHQQGFKFDGQYGQSGKNDARNYAASLSYGTKYAGGNGDLLIVGSYNKRDGLLGAQRDFFVTGGTASGILGTGVYIPSGNPVNQTALNALFASYGASGTVANTGQLSFNDDGTLFARTNGTNFKGDTSVYQIVPAAGGLSEKISRFTAIVTPQTRYSFYGKTKYDISSDINVFASALYTSSSVIQNTGYMSSGNPVALSVPVTNPFLAKSALAPLLATRANPLAPIVFSERFRNVERRTYTDKYETYQLLGGVAGKLPVKDWKFEVSVSYDRTKQSETLANAVRNDRAQALLNAADGGNSLCSGGWNPFGLSNSQSMSQACQTYLAPPVYNATTVSQTMAEATVQGGLFTLPAGEVRFAMTADYRSTKYVTTADADLQVVAGTTHSNIEATPPITPTTGSTNVKEISAELLVPILADTPFFKSLNLDLGYRYSSYNLSGGANTYKADLEWRPFQELLLRGGYAHAIRAPNVGELFSQSLGVFNSTDPCNSNFASRTAANAAGYAAICTAQAGGTFPGYATFVSPSGTFGQPKNGNKNLTPEIADTFTLGAVWQPMFSSEFFNRPSLSVDYYNIRLKNQISFLSGVAVLNGCFNIDGTNPTYDPNNANCKLIVREPTTGAIANVNTPFLNLGGLKTSGIDVQLNWTAGLGSAGKLNFNVAYNHLLSYTAQAVPGGVFLDFKGTVNTAGAATPSLPEDKWLAAMTYSIGNYSLGGRWQHYAAMRDVSLVTNVNSTTQGVAAYNLFDLFARASIGHGIDLRAGVNNLFDKETPAVGFTNQGQTQTNGQLYDIIGRSFYVGVSLRF